MSIEIQDYLDAFLSVHHIMFFSIKAANDARWITKLRKVQSPFGDKVFSDIYRKKWGRGCTLPSFNLNMVVFWGGIIPDL
jgi:hypothetical protein